MQTAQRPANRPAQSSPVRIEAVALRASVGKPGSAKEHVLLHDVSLSVAPGELVAIVGGSGAGKTTLLNALAGVRAPTSGSVLYNGKDLYQHIETFRPSLGYVPQDDIVHKDLSVERTLHYAGKLRLPETVGSEERTASIARLLAELGLAERAKLRVGALSGGQRKRVSIGVELLTGPGAFFLDEPTSGLDPATGRDLIRLLRRLSDAGRTVILTTHAPQDVALCDKVIFLARGGYVAFAGPPARALSYFQVNAFEEIYEIVATTETPQAWSTRFAASSEANSVLKAVAVERGAGNGQSAADAPQPRSTGFLRQWAVLSQRSLEILVRNPLTLAILAGSPLVVIMMFIALFRPGAFDPVTPSPSAALMILFWLAFNSFFFGLTYGLLQITMEFPIFLRERLVFLKILPYVLSKVTILLPVLVFAVTLMLAVLRVSKILPQEGLDLYFPLGLTLFLDGLSALAFGLLTSAAVSRPEQATLAMPMICFPQVLFSGAILPYPIMAGIAQAISFGTSVRWSFEALGHSIALHPLFAESSQVGEVVLRQYGSSFDRSSVESWIILGAFTPLFLALTCLVLVLKSGKNR